MRNNKLIALSRRELLTGASALGTYAALSGTVSATSCPMIFGVSDHLHSARNSQVQTNVMWGSQLGAKITRFDAIWAEVELTQGVYTIPANPLGPDWDYQVNLQLASGIETLMILNYGHPLYNVSGEAGTSLNSAHITAFQNYITFMVNHFWPRVTKYEITNEWDIATGGLGGGIPGTYMQLITAAYSTIKGLQPSAVVLGEGPSRAGMTSYLLEGPPSPGIGPEQLFLANQLNAGILSHCDGLAIHPYCRWGNSFGSDVNAKIASFTFLLNAIDADCRAHNGGVSFPLYITECGWPTPPSNVPILTCSFEDQAALVSQAITNAAARPYVKMFIYYDLIDLTVTTNQAFNYGVVGFYGPPPGNSSKLAYGAAACASRACRPDNGKSMTCLRYRL
jgi:hypothetical protein